MAELEFLPGVTLVDALTDSCRKLAAEVSENRGEVLRFFVVVQTKGMTYTAEAECLGQK